MTRITVLADTHMPRKGRALPREVVEAVQSCDMILHLGDFTEPEVAEYLERHAPLRAVHGNNDSREIRTRFPTRLDLTVGGLQLVLIHGDRGGRTALEAARAEQQGDAVLFGHSHRAFCSWEGRKLLFNPGSPTERRWSPHRSFGLLDVGIEIAPKLVTLT